MNIRLTALVGICVCLSFSQPLRAITFRVDVPSGTHECYIIGVGGDWNNFRKMNKIGTTNIFELDIPEITSSSGGYQYCSGPAWKYEEIGDNGKGVIHSWESINTVRSWKAVYVPPIIRKEIKYRLYNKKDWSYYELNNLGLERDDRVATYPEDNNTVITVVAWNQATLNLKSALSTNEAVSIGIPVKVQNNKILLEDVYGDLSLYSISGALLQREIDIQGSFISQRLEKGVYIISIEGASIKVIIH